MSKTLIIVDMQNDFCDPNGALYVPGAEKIVWAANKYLANSPDVTDIIYTYDCHPENHCSFEEWPEHCVEDTWGCLIKPLVVATGYNEDIYLQDVYPVNDVYYAKGTNPDREEYGAFKNGLDFYKEWIQDEIILCGVAGDYCVLETLKNLKPYWDKITLYMEGIVSIDGGEKLNNFIKENNIKCC